MEKKNLVIDLGNTNAKLALFQNGRAVELHTHEGRLAVNDIEDFIAGHVLKGAILSSVVNHDPEIDAFLDRETPYIRFNATTEVPIKNEYQTPATLGLDRLANAVALYRRFGEHGTALCIDIGTCIKFDLVEKVTYKGGSIAPGRTMRAKALHTFTDKLPFVEGALTPNLTGTTTMESLQAGVMHGMFHEINGMLHAYNQKYPSLQTVITGGDANHFPVDRFLQNNAIFADALFTLKGLESVIDYHETL